MNATDVNADFVPGVFLNTITPLLYATYQKMPLSTMVQAIWLQLKTESRLHLAALNVVRRRHSDCWMFDRLAGALRHARHQHRLSPIVVTFRVHCASFTVGVSSSPLPTSCKGILMGYAIQYSGSFYLSQTQM
jgi:hypothetical protein